jgi:hypothetical protein
MTDPSDFRPENKAKEAFRIYDEVRCVACHVSRATPHKPAYSTPQLRFRPLTFEPPTQPL